ncbi:twin-arginine translocase subunit TatC [Actinoallomurus iriomotensis]|uniref:Sec-independent protein translocase protein TatC n=1 Tax=Actinoallomurus iriomotensis TaxID=478107 RepID=A0A9W6SFZ9_9ACTN|nr:twin-arginine translocase subunit TatC [Actinoallomurus iriomotensis]GLY91542.1 Sec-independent protein translocase protein TatC [Actinoallomurus iriomotensis]
MPLMEHIRELRNRILKALLGIVAGGIVGWIFYDPIWRVLQHPYCKIPQAHRLNGQCALTTTGILDPFVLRIKICLIIGLVLASPIWLYQLWAFVAPGLYQRERRWTYVFMGGAIPLFAAGAFLAYETLDKGLGILLGFTPDHVVPIVTITSYLGYAVAMLLIFGATFELPLFVVILNFAGVLTHARIRKWRRTLVFGIFVFAAVATPSQDPFTMLALALPTVVLFEVAEVIAYVHDRRKAARPDPYAHLSDDEASPLDMNDLDEVEDLEDTPRS